MTDAMPYHVIADVLREQIGTGEHAKGARLPTAKALAAELDVSATTVHRAFAVLQQEGLVTIRAGVGVFVRDWTPILRDANARLSAKQWGSGHSIWEADLGARPMKVTTETRYATEVPTEIRSLLDCARYLVRDRLFTVETERVQLGLSYFDADIAEGTAIAEPETGAGGAFARLGELGLAPRRFREDIRVRKPSRDEAERLAIGAGRTVVEILRENATEDGRVVEVTHMILVADAYVLRYHMHS